MSIMFIYQLEYDILLWREYHNYGTRLKNGTDIAISDFFNYMWSSEYESRLI